MLIIQRMAAYFFLSLFSPYGYVLLDVDISNHGNLFLHVDATTYGSIIIYVDTSTYGFLNVFCLYFNVLLHNYVLVSVYLYYNFLAEQVKIFSICSDSHKDEWTCL
jgi:hypothetical protein